MVKMSKMMNVYEDVEAKEVECIDVIDVLECGYDIIENYRELIEEMTNEEQVSLYEAVRDEFDVDGVLTDVKDQDVVLELFEKYEEAPVYFDQFCVLVELYHHVKDCKRRAERKDRKCCRSVKCNTWRHVHNCAQHPKCSLQHAEHSVQHVQQPECSVQRSGCSVSHGAIRCYCCGEEGHKKYQCPHRKSRCSKCNKVGHTERTCWKKKKVRKCFCCGEAGHVKKECRHVRDRCERCGKVGHLQSQCFQKISQPKVVRVADELNFQPVVRANPFEDVMECLTKAMHDSIARVELPKSFTDSFVQFLQIIVNVAREEYQCGYEWVTEPKKVDSCGGRIPRPPFA